MERRTQLLYDAFRKYSSVFVFKRTGYFSWGPFRNSKNRKTESYKRPVHRGVFLKFIHRDGRDAERSKCVDLDISQFLSHFRNYDKCRFFFFSSFLRHRVLIEYLTFIENEIFTMQRYKFPLIKS